MYGVFDKCILFLFCLVLFPFDHIMPICVLACLLAVAVSAGLSAFPNHASRILFPVYALLVVLFPQPCMFLPLLTYDAFPRADRDDPLPLCPADWVAPFCIAIALLLCLFRRSFGFQHAFLPYRFQLLLLLFGCALAVLLYWKTDTLLRLRQKLLRTKDDDTELQLLLEERNRTLLEKQDNEIYTATLRERNRIAREIHDNVGHLLTRAILMVGAMKAAGRDSSESEPLQQLGDTLNQAMDSIRSSVHDLHDRSVNLEESLRTLTQEFSFCPVSLQYQMSAELPRKVKYSLIAIAKEALVNISRHSSATSASITAIEHPGFYQFIVQDNGTPSDTATSKPSGIGLENIRARVNALNGSLQIQITDGFRIYVTIPRT